MMPKYFSPIFVFVFLIIAACAPAEEPAPSVEAPTVQVETDLLFAQSAQDEGVDYLLDVYIPSKEGNWPVVIFLRGSGGTKEGYARVSQRVAELGAVVYTIDWPTPIIDLAVKENGKGLRQMHEVISCAMQFAGGTATSFRGDPSEVVMIGHSYGGGTGALFALASEELETRWREFSADRGGPDLQVKCSEEGAPISVDVFIGIAGGGRFSYNFVKMIKDGDEELWALTSPYAYLNSNPSLLVRLLHGEKDTNTPLRHTEDFNQQLLENGYDSEILMYDGSHIVPSDIIAELVQQLTGE